MAFLNTTLGAAFDLLLRPVATWPALVPLAILALFAGMFALLVYRWTSNQRALRRIKQKLIAHLLEVRLFSDDLRAVLLAQLRLLRDNLTYLRLNLAPLAWMIVPFVLLIAQLQFHYGYRGLDLGEPTLLVAEFTGDASARPQVELVAPAGVAVETPGVWAPSLNEMAWRLRVDEPGEHEVKLRVGGGEFEKTVVGLPAEDGPRWIRRSPTRRRAALLDQILYPAEPALPRDGPLERIDVSYPGASISFLGLFDVHWLVAFFVLSVAFAFALRGRFGVTL